IAAAITGGRAQPFGMKFVKNILNGYAKRDWPHTPTAAVIIVAAVLVGGAIALAVVAGRLIARLRPVPGDPVAALARNPRMRTLTRLPAARAAAGLRRSLAAADP